MTALSDFTDGVAALRLDAEVTAALAALGKVLYKAAASEGIAHIRLHAAASAADDLASAEQRQKALDVLDVTEPLAQRASDDPRWLQLLDVEKADLAGDVRTR